MLNRLSWCTVLQHGKEVLHPPSNPIHVPCTNTVSTSTQILGQILTLLQFFVENSRFVEGEVATFPSKVNGSSRGTNRNQPNGVDCYLYDISARGAASLSLQTQYQEKSNSGPKLAVWTQRASCCWLSGQASTC